MATDMATDMNIRAFNEEGTSYLYISAHADSEPVRVAVADCLSALQQAPTMLLFAPIAASMSTSCICVTAGMRPSAP